MIISFVIILVLGLKECSRYSSSDIWSKSFDMAESMKKILLVIKLDISPFSFVDINMIHFINVGDSTQVM